MSLKNEYALYAVMIGVGEGISSKGRDLAKVQSLQTVGYVLGPVRLIRNQSAYNSRKKG